MVTAIKEIDRTGSSGAEDTGYERNLEEAVKAFETAMDLAVQELKFKDAQIQALESVMAYYAHERQTTAVHS